jgi:hypothetical protein
MVGETGARTPRKQSANALLFEEKNNEKGWAEVNKMKKEVMTYFNLSKQTHAHAHTYNKFPTTKTFLLSTHLSRHMNNSSIVVSINYTHDV